MDIELLRKYRSRISTQDLEPIMEPHGDISGVISCSYRDLFDLKLIEVGNLFKADKRLIKFRHESNLVISKCEGELKETIDFDAKFDNTPFFECGINYLGRLRIERPGSDLVLRVFGEGSYDPASKDPYLSKLDYTVISGFVFAAIYATKRGANIITVEKIFKVSKGNPSCKAHPQLMDYMQYQIEEVIFQSNPNCQDYAEYLNKNTDIMKRDHPISYELIKKENEDLLTFLYLYKKYERIDIFPCKRYIETLKETRKINNDLLQLFEDHPEVYTRSKPEFLKDHYRKYWNGQLIDMRDIEAEVRKIEENYGSKIKKALADRGRVNEPITIDALTENPNKCGII